MGMIDNQTMVLALKKAPLVAWVTSRLIGREPINPALANKFVRTLQSAAANITAPSIHPKNPGS